MAGRPFGFCRESHGSKILISTKHAHLIAVHDSPTVTRDDGADGAGQVTTAARIPVIAEDELVAETRAPGFYARQGGRSTSWLFDISPPAAVQIDESTRCRVVFCPQAQSQRRRASASNQKHPNSILRYAEVGAVHDVRC